MFNILDCKTVAKYSLKFYLFSPKWYNVDFRLVVLCPYRQFICRVLRKSHTYNTTSQTERKLSVQKLEMFLSVCVCGVRVLRAARGEKSDSKIKKKLYIYSSTRRNEASKQPHVQLILIRASVFIKMSTPPCYFLFYCVCIVYTYFVPIFRRIGGVWYVVLYILVYVYTLHILCV